MQGNVRMPSHKSLHPSRFGHFLLISSFPNWKLKNKHKLLRLTISLLSTSYYLEINGKKEKLKQFGALYVNKCWGTFDSNNVPQLLMSQCTPKSYFFITCYTLEFGRIDFRIVKIALLHTYSYS